jgi:hypothetical protein
MTTPKKSALNPKAIAASITSSGAAGLKSIPEGKVAKIVGLALAAIGKELQSVEQGIVRVQGLGVFRVKSREVEKDGQRSKVRRVGFAPSKPKLPKLIPPTGAADKKA